MNAKRLTALALAALMAASTTSVALASEKVEYDLDFEQGVYYRYDEDEGRIVKADPGYTFAPGEKIYVHLEENTQGDKFSNKKSYDAYAEWKLGDSWVKDIDLVYKKGNITTPGATTTEYYIKGLSGTLASLNGTKLDANTLDSLKAKVEASNEYKTMVENELNTKYKKSAYDVTEDGQDTKYATEDEAAKASLKNAIGKKKVTGPVQYYVHNQIQYQNTTDLPAEIVSANNQGFVTNQKWYQNLTDALAEENGWYLYNTDYQTEQHIYYDSGSGAAYGEAFKDQSSRVELPVDNNYYVNVSKDAVATAGGKISYINAGSIQKEDVTKATNGVIRAATNEYYHRDKKTIETVETKQGGYFKVDGKSFLGDEEVAAGKNYGGYQVVQNVWYDDNGPSTEEKARAAAKAEIGRAHV